MDLEKAKKILLPAARQHQHNDCSGLIPAYDYDKTNEIVSSQLEPLVMQKIAGNHSKLKQEGWEEWIEMNDLTGITENQKQMIKTAYDYGWYNAYGLQSEDKRHSEIMGMLKRLQEKTDSNFSA